jgi:putative redox protein
MVKIEIVYEGGLHCRLKHGPSGAGFGTDAPKDNEGKGESFSPTDLLASALGSCILTTMGIFAKRHGIPFEGARAEVTKEMTSPPAVRRIARLSADVYMPAGLSAEHRVALEKAGLSCPVHKSLHPDVETPVRLHYPD